MVWEGGRWGNPLCVEIQSSPPVTQRRRGKYSISSSYQPPNSHVPPPRGRRRKEGSRFEFFLATSHPCPEPSLPHILKRLEGEICFICSPFPSQKDKQSMCPRQKSILIFFLHFIRQSPALAAYEIYWPPYITFTSDRARRQPQISIFSANPYPCIYTAAQRVFKKVHFLAISSLFMAEINVCEIEIHKN